MSHCDACSYLSLNLTNVREKVFGMPVVLIYRHSDPIPRDSRFNSYSDTNPSFLPDRMLNVLPQAVVLDDAGRVRRSAVGAKDVQALLEGVVE